MSEIRCVQLFSEVVNPKFEIKRNEGYYSWIGIKHVYDKSKEVKVHVDGDVWKAEQPKVCYKKSQNSEDVILFFSDLLLQFSGDIKNIYFTNYNAFKHTLVFVVTDTVIHFYDVYYDEEVEHRKFACLGSIDNSQLLYLAFDEFKKDDFIREIRKKSAKQVTPELFLEIMNSYYGKHRFDRAFEVIKDTNIVAPLYSSIQRSYNIIPEIFGDKEGYKAQMLCNITLVKNAAAIMNTTEIPVEKIINAGFHWIVMETKIILMDTLEIFDVSFIKRQKGKKISLEHRLHTQIFDIRTINDKRILIINVSDNRYILWNLNENKPFLYTKSERSTDFSKLLLTENHLIDDSYYCWAQNWFPHVFIKSRYMESLPEEERQYEIYYNFMTGEPECIISIGKPYILKCNDGKTVYFVKTHDENEKDKVIGMMFILDKNYTFIESRKNINLIAIYDGTGCSNGAFAFVEENETN